MLRATLTLGFFGFLWVDKFTMKNGSFNPRFHPTMQDISWSRDALFCKVVEKWTKWGEYYHLYWAYTPMHVSSGSNGGRYEMLQLFSHSAPLFHYRDGTPLTAKLHLIEQCGLDTANSMTHAAGRAGLPSDTIQELIRWRSSSDTRHAPVIS